MPSHKRARTDTNADDNVTDEPNPLHSTRNLTEIITLLTPGQQKKFLTDAATKHPEPHDPVIDLINKAAEKHCGTSRGLNITDALMTKIKKKYLDVIVDSTHRDSPFETKRNAIEAVREIFEISLLNSDCSMVGRMMRQNFLEFGPYLPTVLGIFSKEEMLRLMDPSCKTKLWNREGGCTMVPWIEAFETTVRHTKNYCVDDDHSLGTSRALAILNAARGMGPEVGPNQTFL